MKLSLHFFALSLNVFYYIFIGIVLNRIHILVIIFLEYCIVNNILLYYNCVYIYTQFAIIR